MFAESITQVQSLVQLSINLFHLPSNGLKGFILKPAAMTGAGRTSQSTEVVIGGVSIRK